MKITRAMATVSLVAGTMFVFAGCFPMAPTPVQGSLYTGVKWDGQVADKQNTGTKQGKSCATAVLGVAAWGDASIEGAKAKGGVAEVSTIDHETMIVSKTSFQKYCTTVTGS